MHFKKVFGGKHFYQIVKQETPSKNILRYSYDLTNKRVEKVKFENSLAEQLAELQFNYPSNLELKHFAKGGKKGAKNPSIKIRSSDGRQVTYKLESFEKHHCDETIEKRRYRITQVKRPNALMSGTNIASRNIVLRNK